MPRSMAKRVLSPFMLFNSALGSVGERRKNHKEIKEFVNGGGSLWNALSGIRGGLDFVKGFGLDPDLKVIDLKKAREVSAYLYTQNEFAETMVNCYLTAVVNDGLRLDANPEWAILQDLGITEDQIQDITEKVEAIWKVWAVDRQRVSKRGKWAWGELQRVVVKSMLLSGDCLVALSVGRDSLPKIQIVDGSRIGTPLEFAGDPSVRHGVKFDAKGRELGYYVLGSDLQHDFVPAWGKRSKRRTAWLVRANDGNPDSVRGIPWLASAVRALNEMGEALEAEQRAMLINSILVLTHSRGKKQLPGTSKKVDELQSFFGGAKKSSADSGSDEPAANFTEHRKGVILGDMADGESVKSHDTKRPNLNVGFFIVEYCMKSLCRAKGFPPERVLMEYGSNYSASQQSKNDLEETKRVEMARVAGQLCQPVYREFFLGLVLCNYVVVPAYLESVIEDKWLVSGAWESAIWSGSPQLPIDPVKLAKYLKMITEQNWMYDDDVCRTFFGTSFRGVCRKKKKIREEFPELFPVEGENGSAVALQNQLEELGEKIEEIAA